MRVVMLAEAAGDLQKIIEDVVAGEGAVIVRGKAGADAVLLSMGHFNSLMETLHLLQSPANAVHLARSSTQLASRIHERFKPLGGVEIEGHAGGEEKD